MPAIWIVLIVVGLIVIVGGVAYVSSRAERRSEPIEPPIRKGGGTLTEEKTDDSLEDLGVEETDLAPADPDAATVEDEPEVIEEAKPKPSFRTRLTKARGSISTALTSILGRSGIDQETWDELEEALLRADVGIGPTTELLDSVRERVKADGLTEPQQLIEALKEETTAKLLAPIDLRKAAEGPSIYLFVGVNGVGKTTTIGKLANQLRGEGSSVVMAAGDTFRAAAAEQLETWAERSGSEFIRGNEGGDPSSVIFDGVSHAANVGADYVLADTAGRLHNKSNLMAELSKVRRVADKGEGEVVEVLLVLDATTGQNGLIQAAQFTEAVEVTGVVLTKLDGSAKGGIVLAINSELGIPVKLVGLGEGIEDLVPFDAEQFSEALFSQDD